MTTTVIAAYTAPNGNRVVAVRFQGREYTVRQTPKLTTTVWLGPTRITKKDNPGAFYDLVQAAYAEWERTAREAELSRAALESPAATPAELAYDGGRTAQAAAELAAPAERITCGLCGEPLVRETPADSGSFWRHENPALDGHPQQHPGENLGAVVAATVSAVGGAVVTAETTVESWGPDPVAVTREYDAPAARPAFGSPAWALSLLPENRAAAPEVLPYRLEQSAPAAWQVLDRQSPALWGTVQRLEESMRPGVVQWTRWVAYRPDGSRAGHASSLRDAARLLVPLSEEARETLAR